MNVFIKGYAESNVHLISITAFVRYLTQDRDVVVKGIVVVSGFLASANDALQKYDFLIKHNIKILYDKTKKNKTLMIKLKETFKEIFFLPFISCNDYNKPIKSYLILPPVISPKAEDIALLVKLHGNCKIIFVEEGIGSYIRSKQRWLNCGSEKYNGLRKELKKIRTRVSSFLSKNVIIKILHSMSMIGYFYMLEKTSTGLRSDYSVCKYIVDEYKYQYRLLQLENIETSYENSIVINTQPFFEQLNINEDLKCYERIIQICDELDIKVILKLHPREKNTSRYNSLSLFIDRENSSISQEILFAGISLKPLAILGFFSTTLVTSKMFFGIDAISLGKLINMNLLNGFDEDVENFIEVFKNMVLVPSSYEDLKHVLDYIKRKNF